MNATLEDKPIESKRTWEIKAQVTKHRAQDMRRMLRPKAIRHLIRGHSPFALVPKPGVRPYEVVTSRHNLLVNAGIQRLEDLLIASGATQAYDATHTRVGVGDDTTAASASQTDLQAAAGSTHRQFKSVTSTGGVAPSRASQTITIVVQFASGEGNFAWQEWCIDVGTADGTTVVTPMLNRKVASLGTKASGTVWTFTVTLTIS